MKRAAYSVERLQEGMSRITVTPDTQLHGVLLLALVPFELVMLVGLAAWLGAWGGGVWVLQVVLTWVLLTRWGEWNRGRSGALLQLGSKGVLRNREGLVPWASIDLFRMTAPHLGIVSLSEAGPGRVHVVGVTPPRGLRAVISERSWRVESICAGRVRVLSGGLTEAVARGVLYEITKAKKELY